MIRPSRVTSITLPYLGIDDELLLPVAELEWTSQFGITNSWGVSSVLQTYDNLAHVPSAAERGGLPHDLLRLQNSWALLLAEIARRIRT